jgi:hypothetical protein
MLNVSFNVRVGTWISHFFVTVTEYLRVTVQKEEDLLGSWFQKLIQVLTPSLRLTTRQNVRAVECGTKSCSPREGEEQKEGLCRPASSFLCCCPIWVPSLLDVAADTQGCLPPRLLSHCQPFPEVSSQTHPQCASLTFQASLSPVEINHHRLSSISVANTAPQGVSDGS